MSSMLNIVIICLADCSGNGEPVLAPGCGAGCRCFGGWEGDYCERIAANGGGDPHLETLDGKKILRTFASIATAHSARAHE